MIRRILLFLLALLFMMTGKLFAETIFMKKGDPIIGKILKYDKDTITIESIKDHGILQIRKSEIYLINFDSSSDIRYKKHKKNLAANIVYLKNGEILMGKITQYNSEFLTIESLKGQGVLQLPNSEVNMITSMDTQVEMGQRSGIGYMSHKSTLSSQGGPSSYQSDMLSYKTYLSEELFSDMLFAFGSASYGSESLKVLAFDYRMGLIFEKYRNVMLYYGGSVGYMSITDTANGISGSGITLGGFVGAEMFFTSMPNFGFSGEVGMTSKNVGNYSSLELSTSAFPALSVRYYF
ncbi:MAG: hypothetical protein QNL04_12890 [SAR324 cluster bacterium]|nr:hypothetical protein [SAR324 cluster bacterium]